VTWIWDVLLSCLVFETLTLEWRTEKEGGNEGRRRKGDEEFILFAISFMPESV